MADVGDDTQNDDRSLVDIALAAGAGASRASAAVGTADPAGIASPTPITDQGMLQTSAYHSAALGELGADDIEGQRDMRQVVKDGQIVYGAKPKKIKYLNSKTSSSSTFSGGGGTVDVSDVKGVAGKIIAFARGALGIPYVWGGTSRNGYDCSGLVQAAFAAAGIKMPRLSYDQMYKGKRIPLSKLRPGDLVGYDYTRKYPGADHIAIYIGGGKIIEAPRPGRSVQIGHVNDTPGAFGARIF